MDVVTSGTELRNVNTLEYIPLKDGRTLPIKFRVELGAILPPSNGFVSRFEGNLLDDRGVLPLTLFGQAAYSPGVSGSAVQSSGPGMGVSASTNVLDNQYAGTVSVWVNLATGTETGNIVSYSTTSTLQSVFAIGLIDGKLIVQHKSASVPTLTPTIYSASAIPGSQWVHVVVVADGVNRVRIFFDGVEQSTVFYSYGTAENGSEWFADTYEVASHDHFIVVGALLRALLPGGETHLNGRIDQLRVLSDVLSPAEVLALYQSRQ